MKYQYNNIIQPYSIQLNSINEIDKKTGSLILQIESSILGEKSKYNINNENIYNYISVANSLIIDGKNICYFSKSDDHNSKIEYDKV